MKSKYHPPRAEEAFDPKGIENRPGLLQIEHKKATPKRRLSDSGWDRTSFRNQAYRLITSCRQFGALAAPNHFR
ncbi:hypothetical protein [Martelella sp. FOR1707]